MPILKFNSFDIKFDIDSKYKAHLSTDRQDKESLKEHMDLVYDYFLKIVNQNNLERHLDSLFRKSANLFKDIKAKKKFANFTKYLFAKAIYWHDMGKLNPNFQKEKMLNDINDKTKITDSNHSLLGSYLFVNHSLNELYHKKFDENEEEVLEAIIYLFGFLISKHHGTLYQYNCIDFQQNFSELLHKLNLKNDYTKKFQDEKRDFSFLFDYIEHNKETYFLLSKSLFSLLTISDYYATTQFMNYGNINELKYDSFGLIDNDFREKIYSRFYENKINKKLKDKSDSDFIIVPSFRFPHEAISPLTVHIKNDNIVSNDAHASENALNDFEFWETVDNTGYKDLTRATEHMAQMLINLNP